MNAGIGAAGKSALSFQFPIVCGRSIPPPKKKNRRAQNPVAAGFPASGIHWGFGLNHCIICQNHFDIHIKQSSLTKGPEKHGTYTGNLASERLEIWKVVVAKIFCWDHGQGGKNNRKSWSSVEVVCQGDMIGVYTYIICSTWFCIRGRKGTKIVRRRGTDSNLLPTGSSPGKNFTSRFSSVLFQRYSIFRQWDTLSIHV